MPVTIAQATRQTLRHLIATVTGVVLMLSVSVAPALAVSDHPDDGEQSGEGLTAIQTLLIFVGIPVAVYVIIALLVSAPSLARGPRYRPGLGWWAAPVWFNGPDDADVAVRTATPTSSKEGGGASARW